MRKKIIIFPILILVVLVLFLLDYYVFQGIKTLTRGLQLDLAHFIQGVYWFISLGLVLSLLYLLYSYLPGRKLTLIFNTIFNSFLALFLSKIVFVLVLFSEDIYRLIVFLASSFQETNSLFPPRSKVASGIAVILSLIPFFSFIFGITRGKYHYQVHHKILLFDDLPDNFNGFTITQLSDIHAGSFGNRKAVQRGVDLVNAQASDLLVFTGDLVNHVADEIQPWVPVFKQLKTKYGKFSILGNHDYGDYLSWPSREAKQKNFENLKHYHEDLGFRLLLNENMRIYKDGQYITLIGIENWGIGFAQHGDLNQALRGVEKNSFKVLLSHDPSHWDIEVKNNSTKIHLTLSGHTHGMQFGIELGDFKWSPAKYRYHNWAGVTEENGKYLYVNRGFGFLGFSGRIGIWPEITVLELRKKEKEIQSGL